MVVRRISDTIDKWVGLSTDVKPSGASVGSYFVNQDNNTVYIMGKTSWQELGSGGGGGNPFNEPVRITVDGTVVEPALNMGEMAGNGFAINAIDFGGAGLISNVINVVANQFDSNVSAIALDPGQGLELLLGYHIGWTNLSDFSELTAENYVQFLRMTGNIGAGGEPLIEMFPTVPEERVKFRIMSRRVNASTFSYLEIESQGDGLDYRIYPSTSTLTDRGLQIGVSGNKLGFFGTTAIAKPTVSGAKAGNAALGSLLTALANLGLLTDSSGA